jgi:hypothetical protein
MQTNFIPNLDPNPLPAPFWVFKLLLVVAFFLHILAMNFLLGGAVLALISRWTSGNQEHGKRAFADIAKKLPSFLPGTITLGIAPLLFVQVLYGQFFYSSSVIVAWPWFLILVFLTIAYYGLYYVSFKGSVQPAKAPAVMLISTLLIFATGFILSNNLTLSQVPSRWRAKYFAHPSGWNLNLSEPTPIPRFLHFFTAAIAAGGLLLVFLALARWNKDVEYSRYLLHSGGKAFTYATMAQFVVGTWFLVSLPRDLRTLFFGGSPLATTLLALALAAALGSILLMGDALRRDDVRRAAYSVTALAAAAILCMSVMRDILRDAYLKPYFHPQQFAVKTQWSVFPLFLLLFVAGVILWLAMLKRYGLFGATKKESPQHEQKPLAEVHS